MLNLGPHPYLLLFLIAIWEVVVMFSLLRDVRDLRDSQE
jgi:hypothetical protein